VRSARISPVQAAGLPVLLSVAPLGSRKRHRYKLAPAKAGVTIGAGIVKAGVKTTIKTPEPLFPPALIAKRQAWSSSR
jgi:hypothetical protein